MKLQSISRMCTILTRNQENVHETEDEQETYETYSFARMHECENDRVCSAPETYKYIDSFKVASFSSQPTDRIAMPFLALA